MIDIPGMAEFLSRSSLPMSTKSKEGKSGILSGWKAELFSPKANYRTANHGALLSAFAQDLQQGFKRAGCLLAMLQVDIILMGNTTISLFMECTDHLLEGAVFSQSLSPLEVFSHCGSSLRSRGGGD